MEEVPVQTLDNGGHCSWDYARARLFPLGFTRVFIAEGAQARSQRPNFFLFSGGHIDWDFAYNKVNPYRGRRTSQQGYTPVCSIGTAKHTSA